jgi:hypothetical protein
VEIFSLTVYQDWLQILSPPVFNTILWHYASEDTGMVSLLREIIPFSWFYEQFTTANGLEWLSCMGLSNYQNRYIILKLLVDQIVFDSTSPDLNEALECSYICLQTLRQAATDVRTSSVDHWNYEIAGDAQMELSHLGDALIWVLQNATKRRNEGGSTAFVQASKPLPFAAMTISKVEILGQAPLGRVRSFEFARRMSDEEWEEWSARTLTMIMGVRLGGLGCGPVYSRHRFVQDPDGICGWTCSTWP